MTPERWQRVEEIFQAAIDLTLEERPAFVEGACAGDEELRREVDSLITADEQGLSFVDEPAFEVAADLLVTSEPELAEGQSFGHYEIVGPIGRGGMGEVYLAIDKLLNRQVALKLLPADYTRDKDRLRRFQQEAQAASALNHPNILTIYALGQVDGQQFIATEFVEGETLRQRIKRGGLSIGEVLDIAVQIAGALAVAHRAGIIHRDIKPENIMVRSDGYVKVLDFGLAKLTEQSGQDPDARLADNPDISSGLVMGTVKYMSPEQACGRPVDQRSDIFSFGVVLYELLAGRTPFEGDTSNDLIAAILNNEPPALTNVPDEMKQLVSRALSKKKEERYQTIQELLLELRILKQDQTGPGGSVQMAAETTAGSRLSTSKASDVSNISSVEYIVSGIKRHKTTTAFVLASLALVVVGLTYSLDRLGSRPSKQMRIEPVPGAEKAGSVAISPDGQFIAYTASDESLWVRELATSESFQIAAPAGVTYPTYSPDAKQIFYVRDDTLYRIPGRGGDETPVLEDVNGHGPISFSPDGKQFAFSRYPDQETAMLVVANIDGTAERVLVSSKKPENLYSPAWSPDGNLIAFAFGQTNLKRGQYGVSVFGIRVATGEEEQITNYKWQAFDRLAWLSDGRGLVASAMETGAGPKQIWHIPYPAGEPRRITNDLEDYVDVSLSADGNSLATVQYARLSNLWISPNGDFASAKSISFGERKLAGFVSWTPDGRILCPADISGERDIWIVNADGTNPRQLTANSGRNLWPQASPDGRYIVFCSNRASSGDVNIWRMDIDGSNPIQLTHGDGEVNPKVSPDGLWVVYTKGRLETGIQEKTLWKVPIDGGEPIQLTNTSSTGAAISPDGTLIACWYKRDKTSPWQIALIPVTGGPPVKTFDVDRASIIPLRWTPDGQAISYVDIRKDHSNIWSQPINGAAPEQVTRLTSERIQAFDWSRDGQLVYLRLQGSRDVILITDFR